MANSSSAGRLTGDDVLALEGTRDIFSNKGLGGAAAVLGTTPVGNAGLSWVTEGAKPNELVPFGSIQPPYLSFVSDDAFLGPNVGASVPGVGGINVGEAGIAVWKGGLIPLGDKANLGLGAAISNQEAGRSFWKGVSEGLGALGKGYQSYGGCGVCFAAF